MAHPASQLPGKAIERSLRRRIHGQRLGATKLPFYAGAWNVDRNRVEYLGSRTTPRFPVARAVRVAISIPIFVEPVRIGGHLHGDGGVVSVPGAAAPRARLLGEAARERIRERFPGIRRLLQYASLIEELDDFERFRVSRRGSPGGGNGRRVGQAPPDPAGAAG